MIYKDEHGEAAVKLIDRPPHRVSGGTSAKPDEPSLWKSKIELGEDLFYEIIRHPVPLDMNTLTALKRSSLGLDLYLWLVYRIFALRAPLRLTWRHVYRQFGADPAKASDKNTVNRFRTHALRELKKIKLAWAGVELLDAAGPPDPASLPARHPSFGSPPASKLGRSACLGTASVAPRKV